MHGRLERRGHHDRDGLAEEGHLPNVVWQLDPAEVGEHAQHFAVADRGRRIDSLDAAARDGAAHQAAYTRSGTGLSAAYTALPVTLSLPSTRVTG